MSDTYKNKIIENAIENLRQKLIRQHSGGERRNEKRRAFEKACQEAKNSDKKG